MKKKYLLWFLTAIFILMPIDSAQAVAIKVVPSEIKVEGVFKESVKSEIIVENPDQNVALYEIYPDSFSSWLNFKPASFVLESGEVKKIVLEARGKELGVFFTTISIVAKPMTGNGLRMNSGVKIPLEITVIRKEKGAFIANILNQQIPAKHLLYIITFSILVLGTALFLLRRKRSRSIL